MENKSKFEMEVNEVEFQDFKNLIKKNEHKENINIDELAAIELEISVRLGQTQKEAKDILKLKVGDTLEVDTIAGEMLDVVIGDYVFAKGEVVPIDNEFAVVIKEVVSSKSDFLKNIKKNGEGK